MTDGLTIRRADLTNPADAADYRDMLNRYACDPLGQDRPLEDAVLDKVLADLAAHPTVIAFLARRDGQAVGYATCFLGYSTFKAAPLLNIHDIAVVPECRRQGIARAIIEAIADEAGRLGCCRLSLEVREDNPGARRLYEQAGFGVSSPGGKPVAHHFMERPLQAQLP